MRETKVTVDLLWTQGLHLIVPHESGVVYTNQVGGHGCYHPSLEGLLIPLPVRVGNQPLHTFSQHFRGQWNALEESDARVVDGALRSAGLGYLQVDRRRLAESFEAWVVVTIDTTGEHDLFRELPTNCGILTWPNSD